MSRAGADSIAETCEAIRKGDRRAVARTITLLESTRPEQAEQARRVLDELVPHTGAAVRMGISGPPGVGKSTFIEALGLYLLGRDDRKPEREHRVAVMAVDPSSPVSGGSILGDKTRMERLAQEERAFIRPSPTGGSLGGVAERTREALVVCEAAGFDVLIVETVGVGQSEYAVGSMVDFFLVLVQPGAGDELQGIKKGVLELADALVVNKADGEQLASARRAQAEYAHALDLLRPPRSGWKPRVLLASAATGAGIPEIWDTVREHRATLEASGALEARRREQARAWMWSLVERGLRESFRKSPEVARRIESLEKEVEAREVSPTAAARALLEAFRSS